MSDEEDGSRFVKAVEVVTISTTEAAKMVDNYHQQSRKKYPHDSEGRHQERVANKIITHYSRMAASVGVASALPSVVPGLGTAIALIGGTMTDAIVCMKLQTDMCLCLAVTYHYDPADEDTKHLAFLLAAGGTLERAGVEAATRVASQAGVRLLRQYLRGAVLKSIKELFKKIGVIFTRKALEKSLPFGIGVVAGGTSNLAFTRYVGRQAKKWLVIDTTTAQQEQRGDTKPAK